MWLKIMFSFQMLQVSGFPIPTIRMTTVQLQKTAKLPSQVQTQKSKSLLNITRKLLFSEELEVCLGKVRVLGLLGRVLSKVMR
jgi:hypothetical protein